MTLIHIGKILNPMIRISFYNDKLITALIPDMYIFLYQLLNKQLKEEQYE